MEMIIGKYVETNSIIHKMDPRTKLILMVLLIVLSFIINNFYTMLGFFGFVLFIVSLSKISLFKYLNALKPIIFIMVFTAMFQVFFNQRGEIVSAISVHYSYLNFIYAFLVVGFYQILKRFFKKKFLLFFLSFFAVLSMFLINTGGPFIVLGVYQDGINLASFLLIRILSLVLISSLLTLTTKTMDLNMAIEYVLTPLKVIKVPAAEISLMISIALRFIPTLLEEANKIIKAQSSRGVDFRESNFKSKVSQIISLLIPMFIISLKRADDLANAMEARSYVPGKRRTKLVVLKYHFIDYFSYVLVLTSFGLVIYFNL